MRLLLATPPPPLFSSLFFPENYAFDILIDQGRLYCKHPPAVTELATHSGLDFADDLSIEGYRFSANEEAGVQTDPPSKPSSNPSRS
jgi:hypothetical protein